MEKLNLLLFVALLTGGDAIAKARDVDLLSFGASDPLPTSLSTQLYQSNTPTTLPVSSASGTSCDGAAYTPTWWLPQASERRRAIQYATISAIACEYGLPTRLLDAVIAQESGYDTWALSSAGAMGIMQIMPDTAQRLGLSRPWDPIANMRAGARYLRQQIDRFGRVDLALAAYNAGPERRSLRAGYLPAIPETMNYVRTITTNWARLTQQTPALPAMAGRAEAANLAVRAAGFREVTLSVYDGINAANPI